MSEPEFSIYLAVVFMALFIIGCDCFTALSRHIEARHER